jgi:hypothetical protein
VNAGWFQRLPAGSTPVRTITMSRAGTIVAC